MTKMLPPLINTIVYIIFKGSNKAKNKLIPVFCYDFFPILSSVFLWFLKIEFSKIFLCCRLAKGFLEIFSRFFRFSSRFWKVRLLLTIFSSKLILSSNRCFSINWNYLRDTVLLFELCFILLQPVLAFWIIFFKVLIIGLFKSLYVDITLTAIKSS